MFNNNPQENNRVLNEAVDSFASILVDFIDNIESQSKNGSLLKELLPNFKNNHEKSRQTK